MTDNPFPNKKWKKEEDQEPVWDFEKNPKFSGVLVEKREGLGENNSTMYVVESEEDNQKYGIWGSALIDRRLGNKVIGTEFGVVYKGRVKSKQGSREYKNYEFYFSDDVQRIDDTIDEDIEALIK